MVLRKWASLPSRECVSLETLGEVSLKKYKDTNSIPSYQSWGGGSPPEARGGELVRSTEFLCQRLTIQSVSFTRECVRNAEFEAKRQT